jgi:2-amino-4-hydroxy-6-hydroxymethyldihydropteridine diphosphokinase
MAQLNESADAVFISVGANIAPEENIQRALSELAQRVRLTAISEFYRSTPFTDVEQPQFINGIIQIQTEIDARSLKFGVLRKIESRMGRVRGTDKNAARCIDLDIVLYGQEICYEDDLRIPDPDLCERNFLFEPLLELAPSIVLPDSGQALKSVVDRKAGAALVAAPNFTHTLRRVLSL